MFVIIIILVLYYHKLLRNCIYKIILFNFLFISFSPTQRILNKEHVKVLNHRENARQPKRSLSSQAFFWSAGCRFLSPLCWCLFVPFRVILDQKCSPYFCGLDMRILHLTLLFIQCSVQISEKLSPDNFAWKDAQKSSSIWKTIFSRIQLFSSDFCNSGSYL